MFYNFLGKREQDDSNFMILTRMLQQDNSFVSFVAYPLCFLLRLYKGVLMLGLHLMAIIIGKCNELSSLNYCRFKIKKICIYLTF